MITETTTIKPIASERKPAIDVASECYAKWRGDVNFMTDLADYLRHGVVIARPDIFGMAKIIDWQGEPTWFVRIAVGDLRELLAALPCYLPKICFCRRGGVRVRVYPLRRVAELTGLNKAGE